MVLAQECVPVKGDIYLLSGRERRPSLLCDIDRSRGWTPLPRGIIHQPSLWVQGWHLRSVQLRFPVVNLITTWQQKAVGIMQGSVFLREWEWEIMISLIGLSERCGRRRSGMDRLPSYQHIYRWLPRDLLPLKADTRTEDLRGKLWLRGRREEEVRVPSLSEPLSSTKCYVFDWQTVLILPHPPIAALDSHAKHQRWWERL